MNYIDLFSGAGGLSLGFKNAGFNLVYSNEIDNYAVKTQKQNLQKLGESPDKVISCSIEALHSKIIGQNVKFEFQGKKILDHNTNKLIYKNAKN